MLVYDKAQCSSSRAHSIRPLLELKRPDCRFVLDLHLYMNGEWLECDIDTVALHILNGDCNASQLFCVSTLYRIH